MSGIKAYECKIMNKIDRFVDAHPNLNGFRYSILNSLSLSSVYTYLTRVNDFLEYTGKNPADLVYDDYTVYLGKLRGKTSSHQITTYSALKKYSNYLTASQINTLNPMQYIDRPKFVEGAKTKAKRAKGYLEQKEIVHLKNNIEDGIGSKKAKSYQENTRERDLAILAIFLNTGIRCSALCKIDVDDVNMEEKSITITDKGSKTKDCFLSDNAWEIVCAWLEKRKEYAGNDYALFIKTNGERIGYYGVNKLIQKYASDIEGKHITPHKLRATYGTQLYNATHDIYFVQKCMGHNSATTTQLYIRGNDGQTKEASEIMGKLLT